MSKEIIDAYNQGFVEALQTYAHMKDGVMYVGTTGRTLKDATAKFKESWNYNPPNYRLPEPPPEGIITPDQC